MARRRRSDYGDLTAREVAELVDEQHPMPSWGDGRDWRRDWDRYVNACRVAREQREALASRYGYGALDLYLARRQVELQHPHRSADREGLTHD